MKRIYEKTQIEKALCSIRLKEYFSIEDLPFYLVHFDPGETVQERYRPDEYLLFLVSGKIRISNIHADGSEYELVRQDSFTVLGDMEFAGQTATTNQISAVTSVLFAVLPLRECRKRLQNDPAFLMFLLKSISEKMDAFASSVVQPASLKEKAVYIIRHRLGGVIKHVTQASEAVGCSRRQFQRILNELQEEGILTKEGKGHYILHE